MAPSPVTAEHVSAPATPPATPVPATGWGLLRGVLVVAVVLLLVGALAWFVFGIGTSEFVDSDAKRVLERQKILADRNTEDAKLLHDPASLLDKGKGIVRVPIDDAVKMTVADLQKLQKNEQPHPAYPLKQSPPQPANAPTSPDKGAGATDATVAPSASNPTVGQPSPAPVAAPTPAPATSASNAPAATPIGIAAPSPDNNANNPGKPPIPGTSAQPPAPTPATAPAATPATGSKPEPLTAPPAQSGTATPAALEATTPTPSVTTPGASPAGMP